MTWGSNATYRPKKCRYCGAPDIDDRDEGHSTHELQCQFRHWWVRLRYWWWMQQVNASLESTADEIITIHRDGSTSTRRGPMVGC